MGSQETRDRIPAHLRKYVVEQDYEAYDIIDHNVWRFVLLQTYNMLRDWAHPIYVEGLKKTGINIDTIPRISEMDRCLNAYGWGAVGVDGFIPPRAFQEFQALGIMTIATEIRTHEHVAYTPAPDIIHESAGHSPIVPDDDYRAFLARFGEIGKKTFSSPEDNRVYNAIRNLSEMKEDRASTKAMIAAAEQELIEAGNSVTFLTEAALLTRLHWWTVEYGLIGTPSDYKIYGAGILSSVGETFFLHDPKVKKIALSKAAVDYAYDITEKQPQLFVVEEFPQLNEVLDEVVAGFAFRVGGKHGLDTAIQSEEVGTVQFNSGLQVSGVLSSYAGQEPAYLRFSGPCQLSYADKLLPGHDRRHHAQGYGTPVGPLADGTALSTCRPEDLKKYGYNGSSSRVVLAFRSGVKVEGLLEKVTTDNKGYLLLLTFKDCRVLLGDELLFDPAWGVYDMGVGEEIPSVFAGVADNAYWPETKFCDKRVPKKKEMTPYQQSFLKMFNDSYQAHCDFHNERMIEYFEDIVQDLKSQYPDHWLLRWNLLESLVKRDCGVRLASRIKEQLLEIESRHWEDFPISMGLRYLGMIGK